MALNKKQSALGRWASSPPGVHVAPRLSTVDTQRKSIWVKQYLYLIFEIQPMLYAARIQEVCFRDLTARYQNFREGKVSTGEAAAACH